MLSGNFSQATLILSFTRFSTEVIFRLCCKSSLSQLSSCIGGNRKHFKDERYNNKTDNKEFAETLITPSLCHIRDQLQQSLFGWFCCILMHDVLMSGLSCMVPFNLWFPFSSSKIQQTKNPVSSSCVCWGQRCSRLNRTLQIEFTLDETNRFACVYPPETSWPAPGNEPSHLQTVQCAQLINGLLLEKCVRL